MSAPVVAAYGMGTNSTAFLIEMVRLGEPVDLVLAADTGGERPETYVFAGLFSEWLTHRGYPPVTFIRKGGRAETLEENCLRLSMLPSLAYGWKACSHKYKIEPQEKFVNNWALARAAWAQGEKVVKVVGYDVDEPHRPSIEGDAKYTYRYPLREWGWGRRECIAAIEAAGLPLPGKSSCFFCPASRKPEILELRDKHPALLRRALAIEARAHEADNLKTVNGLGRRLNWSQFLIETAMAATPPLGTELETDVPCGCYDESDE